MTAVINAVQTFPELESGRRGPVWWSRVEQAIHDWILRALDLEDGHVVFEQQGVTRPGYPFVSLLRTAVTTEGGVDETRHQYDPDDDELEIRTLNTRAFTLQIRTHADRDCGPDDDAMAMAERLRASLYTEDTCARLERAGLAVIRDEPIQDISEDINSGWVSRANLDVRMRVTTLLSQRATYVEKVQAASVDIEPPIDIEVDSAT